LTWLVWYCTVSQVYCIETPRRRTRMRNVFEGRIETPVPVSMRLDLWHRKAALDGTLPTPVLGLTVEQVEDLLGFCRSSRYRARVRFRFPEGWENSISAGDTVRVIYSLPAGELVKESAISRDQRDAGMVPLITRYPINSERECEAFTEALAEAEVAHEIGGFADYDRAVGPSGMPMLILGSCPASFAMLALMGYANFFYAMADYPESLERLIAAIGAKFRAQLWPAAMASGAELVLHGNHFSDDTTPPAIFRRFFLPYFRDFNALAHANGKRVVWHADAGMKNLLRDVAEAGFDGADCLATAPLVKQTLEDCYAAWGGRIVCWGGMPGTIFDAAYPAQLFKDYVTQLHKFVSGKPGFIIGASDNVMPGADWERIELVSRTFCT